MQAKMKCLVSAVVLVVAFGCRASAAVKPEQVPTFEWRARTVSAAAGQTSGQRFDFTVGWNQRSAAATGANWSVWTRFDTNMAAAVVGPNSYPNCYMAGFPVVLPLLIAGIGDAARCELQVRFDGGEQVASFAANLYAGNLGLLLWRETNGSPRVATMAEYNRRYWDAFKTAKVTKSECPTRFPIVDRFITGDGDLDALREGITALSGAGFSALMTGPDARSREILNSLGLRRTAGGVYNPPGYAWAHDPAITPQAIEQWAQDIASPYLKAGFVARDMAAFAMSDEPGWYFPAVLESIATNAPVLERFRAYVRAQGLAPADVGAASWDQVMPSAERMARALPARRLFYWTIRFVARDSAEHFANCTRALEKAFYPGLPVHANWNFFNGRFYFPGPFAHNRDKTSPQAGMGCHDWLEFGRLRGGTMLWTEDWFQDNQAYQWSYYCAKLRSAAALGGVEFGGYVIPRAAGQREDGILQKILTVVGSGGKAVQYFLFGPEYNFPGNCYSGNLKVLPKMAEAHRMIGAAEDLLWPGRMAAPETAILQPRSAQAWDARETVLPTAIVDATNTKLDRGTVDYFAEVFGLYLALQHANVPVRFVDEDDLSVVGLAGVKVLYVTEPNIPAEGQRGLAEWVAAGGTLVTTSGAGSRDRYDEPCDALSRALGLAEQPRERLLVGSVRDLPAVGKGTGEYGAFTAFGARTTLDAAGATVWAAFDDGAPAIAGRPVGQGQAVRFGFLPGISYMRSADRTNDCLPAGFSDALRAWIVRPTVLAGVRPPVRTDHALVETPLLLSEGGAAMTVLNWTGGKIESLHVDVRVPFKVGSVRSVKEGRIRFRRTADGVSFRLPVGAADIVMLRR